MNFIRKREKFIDFRQSDGILSDNYAQQLAGNCNTRILKQNRCTDYENPYIKDFSGYINEKDEKMLRRYRIKEENMYNQ